MSKILEFAPAIRSVDLGDGRSIKVCPLSLYHIAMGEKEFGNQETFFKALFGKSGVVAQLKAMWVIVENKDDFGNDPMTFGKFINIEVGKRIAEAAAASAKDSLPDQPVGGEGKAEGKPKKKRIRTGVSSSPTSAGTTS